jgi:hypothetical protein
VRGSVLRRCVMLTLVSLGLTLLPPLGHAEVWASPVTLSETLDELPAVEGSAVGPSVTPDPAAESRSEVLQPEITFNAIGIQAPMGTDAVFVRTGLDDADWTEWDELDFIAEEDGPDTGTAEAASEAAAIASGLATEPLWVGEATHLQVMAVGAEVGDLEITVIDSMGSSGGPVERRVEARHTSAGASNGLTVISRAQWGADESLRKGTPSYASKVHMGVVHHTAHATGDRANNYTQGEAAGIMRAMYRYHTVSLGWSDLGYNVVVDKFGNIYEGRAGGFDRAVVGAHARDFNSGSFGVSVIGNFAEVQAPKAAIASLTRVIGVKSAIHGIDPAGWTDQMKGTTWRPRIVGHRDVGSTTCPGRINSLLPQIRTDAAAIAKTVPTGSEPIVQPFKDVSSTSPHRDAIFALADAGVTQGCTIDAYCPKGELTRAQAASFVMRALELQPVAGSNFTDVTSAYVHAPAINALAQRGLLVGYADGTFRPNQRMTRGQLMTVLSRSKGYSQARPSTSAYSDVATSNAHAAGIMTLHAQGIVGSCGSGKFCPDDVVLRDSTASFVHMVRQLP